MSIEKHTLQGEYETRRVWMDGEELKPGPSLALRDHSPDGFAWGYGGSGPAQLSLVICLRMYTKPHALVVYQNFKWKHVANLPQEDFF